MYSGGIGEKSPRLMNRIWADMHRHLVVDPYPILPVSVPFVQFSTPGPMHIRFFGSFDPWADAYPFFALAILTPGPMLIRFFAVLTPGPMHIRF